MPMEQEHAKKKHHFVVVTYPSQSHINPARHLARRLMRAAAGARVTISTPVSAYRKMFPSTADDVEHCEGGMAYVPYSDGYDGGFDRDTHDHAHYMSQVRLVGSRTLSAVLGRLRAGGRPVTCAVYTLLLPWVADVARENGVPATAVFWIQSATALAAYYHYFRGHGVGAAVAAVAAARDPWATVTVPGLPPLRVRDLPSFLTITSDDDPFAFLLPEFRDLIDALDGGGSAAKPMTPVLVNSFEAMEPDALASLRPHVDIVAVGPVLSFLDATNAADIHLPVSNDLFDHDGEPYLEWLGTKPAKSVVYISFGSFCVTSKKQIAEIARAMKQVGKPFLWVLRKDCRKDQEDDAKTAEANNGMVVSWCDQARVLSHPSVGCFVTHSGWNSTQESVASGEPMVAVPQLTDQGTSAWLVERTGVGVRAVVADDDGVLQADELTRCVEVAMSEMVREAAEAWKETAREAAADGDRNLRDFLVQVAGCN